MRPASWEDGWFSIACGGPLWRVPHVLGGGADEKARIERLCLSLLILKNLNSKVIKSFVPEQRSRYVFFEFRDFYVLSLWTFDVRFTHSHIMAMVNLYKNGFGIK